MKQTKIINLFENEDFVMRLLAGEFDSAIKKGKMKIEPVYGKKQIDLGDTVVTEATTMEELMAPAVDPVDELVEAPLDEVLGIEPVEVTPVEEPVIDEVPAQKCTDIDLAISVINGSCTDMSEEDFDSEVWAIAVDCTKPKKELEFLLDRARTVESWKQEDSTSEASDYVYEDDEVNVPEECDATILSFGKAFDCMSNKEEPAQKSRLDTLLDIIIENQEEYKAKYDKYIGNCVSHVDLLHIGLEPCDLTDKALARSLYRDIRSNSIPDGILLMHGTYEDDEIDKYKAQHDGIELFSRDDLLDVLKKANIFCGIDYYGIEDEVNALTYAVA